MANWIAGAVPASHRGMLHRALGVPQGERIPAAKLEAARHSKNPHMRHMANFAHNIRTMLQRRKGK